jgi:outer membrane receptor protein involved in Fe transport
MLKKATATAFLLLALIPISLLAQVTTGTITGRVTDPSGSAVPNAKVTVTEQNTGVSTQTVTAAGGDYTAPLLKPGTYSVTVRAGGFAPAQRKDISLQIQQTAEVDFQLTLGQLTQEVQVVGSGSAPLQTASAEVGNVITKEPIEQFPLNGRNFSQLALMVPGTNPGPVGGIRTQGNGNETQRAGAEIVANGARGSFTNFMIDGIDDRDQSVGTAKVFPLVEGIEEFKVQTSNYDAEFAGGGAVINVTSRSGSNALHGSAFEFLRNDAFDARQFFDARKPMFRQNQFGFALGGPIRKNKLFFFGDYQGLRIHQAQTVVGTVPTAIERTGNFSDLSSKIFNPDTFDPAARTRQPFAGNTIPAQSINPIAKNLLALYPLPNLPGTGNNFRTAPLRVTTQDQFDVRADHTLSEKDTYFARVTWGRATVGWPATPPLVGDQINPVPFVASLRNNNAPSGQATIQETHVFGPTLVNHFAAGYTRFNLQSTPVDFGLNVAQRLGLKGANTDPTSSAMSSLSISGLSSYSSSFQPEIVPQNTWQWNDTLAWVRGAHSMKFGFSFIRNDFGFFQLRNPSGGLSFSGVYTNNPASTSGTGDGFADFLLGLPDGSTKSVSPAGVPQVFYNEIGSFAQDQWRVLSNLTLNFGLRWDVFTAPYEKYNRQSDFNPSNGQIVLAGQQGISRGILDTRKNNFSPRLGFAYTLTPKTVIRGAYGLFFFNEQGTGSSARLFIAYPFDQEFSVSCSATSPCLRLSDGIPPVGSLQAQPIAVYIPTADQTSNVQQWNFTIQRQLSQNLSVQGAYVGSKGSHLFIAMDENVAVPGAGAVAARRPYPAYSTISSWEPRGNSSYNSLQLSAENRFSGGLWFLASYTWSKSLDYGGGGNSSSGDPRINIQNPRNLRGDRGLSNFDYRQRFSFGHLYQLPFGKGRHFLNSASGIEEQALGGWDLRGIVTLQAGAPTTPVLNTATANTGTFTRPDRVCNGNLDTSSRSLSRWYDTSCFVNPAPLQFGDSGRNIIIGPGLATYDFSLTKDFRVSERTGLEFRSEFFNLLNRPNFDLPNRSIGSRAAGTISGVITNARQIQFGLRLHF